MITEKLTFDIIDEAFFKIEDVGQDGDIDLARRLSEELYDSFINQISNETLQGEEIVFISQYISIKLDLENKYKIK